MIVFTNIPEEVINYLYTLDNKKSVYCYNYTSYSEKYMTLIELFPSVAEVGADIEASDYEDRFIRMIYNNPNKVSQMMAIMVPLFEDGADIVITIDNNDPWRVMLNEMLGRTIFLRYGYPVHYVTCYDDIFNLYFATEDSFSIKGTVRMDYDVKNYLLTTGRVTPVHDDYP